jgi:hypothetical protein
LHQSRVVDSAQETAGNGQPRLARTWTCYTIITHHRVTQLVRSSSRCSRVLLLPGLCLALTHTVMDNGGGGGGRCFGCCYYHGVHQNMAYLLGLRLVAPLGSLK